MKKIWNSYKKEFIKNLNQFKNRDTRIKQIPNLLTFSRLLAPIIIIPLILLDYLYIALIITVLFALTDLIDGRIARKYNAVSEFGRELDPICDKVFVGGLIIPLMLKNNLLIINLFLELLVSILTIYTKKNGGSPKTNFLGKVKTTFLYILVAYTYMTLFKKLDNIFFIIIFMITLIIQITSLITYSYEFLKGVPHAKRKNI